jgi:hypothetical protein
MLIRHDPGDTQADKTKAPEVTSGSLEFEAKSAFADQRSHHQNSG